MNYLPYPVITSPSSFLAEAVEARTKLSSTSCASYYIKGRVSPGSLTDDLSLIFRHLDQHLVYVSPCELIPARPGHAINQSMISKSLSEPDRTSN